jgi:hypothetical protein
MQPDDKDLAELINAALDTSKQKEAIGDRRYKEVQLFIRVKGMEETNQPVPFLLIYNAYKKWSEDPLGKPNFGKQLRKFFKSKMLTYFGMRVYYINPESVGLHPLYTVYRDPHYYKSRRKEPKTQYLGVYYNQKENITVRVIMPDGNYKQVNGKYKTLRAAARAYDKYMIEIYGKDAVVNFPNKWNGQLHGSKKKKQDQSQTTEDAAPQGEVRSPESKESSQE